MKALTKDGLMEIKNNVKRFISLVLIVFLGVGFFAGIKATSPDMQKTVDTYFDAKNVMDLEVISTLGLTEEDVTEISKIEGVESIEGSYSKDVLLEAKDKEEYAVKVHTLLKTLNGLDLIEGRFPEAEGECVVEEGLLRGTDKNIGDSIRLQEKLEENEEAFLTKEEMKIVGVVKSPLYISRERGSTKLASGKISYYLHVPMEAVHSEVYTEIYVTVKDTKHLLCFSTKYKDKVEEVKKQIDEIAEARKEARYQSIKQEAEDKVNEAEKELKDKKQEAEKQIKEAEEEIQSNEKKIEDSKKEIDKAEREIKTNEATANSQFSKAEKELQGAQQQLQQEEENLQKGKQEYEQNKNQLQGTIQQIEAGINSYEKAIKELEEQKKQAEDAGVDSSAIEMALQNAITKRKELEIQKTTIVNGLKEAENKLVEGGKQLVEAKKLLETQKQTLETTKKQTQSKLAVAKKQIKEGKEKIAEGEKQLKEGKEELNTKKQEAEEKIKEAEEEIQDAKDKIKEIKRPTWYLLSRSQNAGYVSYQQDADRISNIGKVFPVVFFVVAALISLTSMTRMVEEQRTQIGTLKGLGYSKFQIAKKYIYYAGLATLIGSLAGMVIGFQTIPRIITDMYGMMYETSNVILEFNIQYAILGLALAMLCTVGATVFSIAKELASTPAVLMRPKAPKMGKRVLLEKIPLIWSKLKFTQKVTVRNIFRYKKRFLMTIIGILGCTSLIVAGFGLRDSVSRMIPSQYGEVFQYDVSISFKEDTSRKIVREKKEEIEKIEGMHQTMLFNEQAIDILDKDNTQDIQLIVPKEKEGIEEYIHLESASGKETSMLTEEGVILTEKIARLLNIKIGDTIRIKNLDDKVAEVKVTGIVKNYLMHYMYMSEEQYQTAFEDEIKYNTILGKTEQMTEEREEEIGKQILQDENISNISFTSSTKSIFAEVMDNMTFVVWILIVSAGLLAFVVLYNLSNVNISERIRELATIKVLGFYDKEVYKYITRETVLLTIIGIVFGLVAGYILNMFIIKTCELDILMFDYRVNSMTYVYSTAITIFFTMVVNIVTYFSLKKIDMIESLKSVE